MGVEFEYDRRLHIKYNLNRFELLRFFGLGKMDLERVRNSNMCTENQQSVMSTLEEKNNQKLFQLNLKK